MHGILIPCPFPHLTTCVSISYPFPAICRSVTLWTVEAERLVYTKYYYQGVSARQAGKVLNIVNIRTANDIKEYKKLRIALRHERFRNALNIRNPAPRQLFCPFAWLRWTVKQYIPHCLAPGKCLQMLMRAWHLQLLSSLLLTYSPRGCCTGHKRQYGGFLYL